MSESQNSIGEENRTDVETFIRGSEVDENKYDVSEDDVDWEHVVEDVSLNRSTDPDTLAVQWSESLLSFSPACHRLFREYKLSSNSNDQKEEESRLNAFITNYIREHSPIQDFSNTVRLADNFLDQEVHSAREDLQNHLRLYVRSAQFEQIHKEWVHTMMHSAFKESVDKCRRTLQESNQGVKNKIQIDLCHVYGLLYLSRVKDGPTRLNAEMLSTIPDMATLWGLLYGNPEVVQILLFLSAGSPGAAPVNLGRNGPGRPVNEIIYFTEPANDIYDERIIPRASRGVHVPVPLCSHMNVWGNPQPCRMATNWLLSGDLKIYQNPFELIQKQLNSTREQFEAIVIMLDSILEAAHEFLYGQSLFEIAPYFDTYGVLCPKSHPNGVLLREINYQRLPEPLDET